ncbi:unnamed protein product [Schistosoma curassoni]|uniref:Uncharacterized protein n=1 Tax=Schistosoma curassoni TaxID=6186 RepID=A0A183KMY7_9TREM|nr:unnamed protein product [Schistosoma curassoni]
MAFKVLPYFAIPNSKVFSIPNGQSSAQPFASPDCKNFSLTFLRKGKSA